MIGLAAKVLSMHERAPRGAGESVSELRLVSVISEYAFKVVVEGVRIKGACYDREEVRTRVSDLWTRDYGEALEDFNIDSSSEIRRLADSSDVEVVGRLYIRKLC